MNPSPWFDVGGDSGLRVAWEDGDRVFCRGWRDGADGDRNTVLIVLPAAEHPTPDSLNRLTHEYGLKDDLNDAWAARPVALTHYNDRMTLVLEDPGGAPLDRLLARPLDVAHFLRIAIPLAGALRRVHERGLIHKDIKPANILVGAANGGVWLTGFGIASRLPREHQTPAPPEVIAGTLAYMAPEQTGRMNRSVDSRSDLYALGVTFYEMLTGTLPFTAADPMEWVHCHIARQAVPPDERVVASGTPELVLVSGYSGIGKSSVVNELHKGLVPPRGLFASGKFDQYKRDIPYSTLAQAFQSLIRTLFAKSEAELNSWREALREALSPNGRLIVDLVPELKLIIGEQPPVADLEPQDAQRRFQLVFRRFICVFARPEHPLALFLDDLQWLDAATLDFLEDLLTQPDVHHLMLIGAYRDNEVDSTHSLWRRLEAIRQTGATVHDIVLAPLAREDLGQLIVDSLHCELECATPLVQLVQEKTGANPFFVIQFIYALVEEQLLSFDHNDARWFWDLNRIHAKGYTDNVVELMVGKLNRLPVETQKALQELPCLGNSAEISTISIVHGTSEEQVHSDLWEAVRLEFIAHQDGAYKFVHDRIQEAAYSQIPEHSRAEAHLRIGRLLWAHFTPEKREEAIFEIVNQLNRGAALITSPDERERVAELNLVAGKRAKASTAYVSALNYLAAGSALLFADCWDSKYHLIFPLELHRAESEFLTGQSAAAEERLTALSSRASNAVDLATVTCLLVDLYTTLNKSERAVAVSLDYLRYLGVEWSPHPTEEEARLEYERLGRQC